MSAERWRARIMENPEWFPAELPPPSDPRFGSLGYTVGTVFESRAKLQQLGLHTRSFAGISGTARLGAFSVVVSGGYADDIDEGDFIAYTGTGGQGDSFGGSHEQVSDQSFSHPDNQALQRSCETGAPVRVFRGPKARSEYAPESGYRFDGMYRVEQAFMDKGLQGFLVCKFHLRRVPGQPPLVKRVPTQN